MIRQWKIGPLIGVVLGTVTLKVQAVMEPSGPTKNDETVWSLQLGDYSLLFGVSIIYYYSKSFAIESDLTQNKQHLTRQPSQSVSRDEAFSLS